VELETLNSFIDEIDQIGDSQWLESLDERKRKELEFHDADRDVSRVEASRAEDTYEKFYGNKKYYKVTHRSQSYVSKWIAEHAKDKVFLDYACGNGHNARLAASNGAALSLGLDISSVSVRNASASAKEEGLSNIRFFQADAEATKLPDESVDTIICSGMLHHLDLSHALPELRRILKPGGRLLAVEALDYNPAIKIYRMLTPEMRTDWEKAHILDLSDVRFAQRFFSIGEIKYWHVIGYVAGKFPKLLRIMDGIDTLLERVPFLQRWSWMFTFELVKSK
jgi:ubiquinone/menaquinone biosynthesis C-methylase UbiE